MRTVFDNFELRLLQPGDLDNYFALIEKNRKRLEDFFAGTVAMTRTLKDTEQHVADAIAKLGKRQYFPFVVIDSSTGKLIASLQVKSIDWNIPKAELGYYIDADYEGKGIVTRAIAHIIVFCFNGLQLNKLFIRTYEGNAGSRMVAEKNGFTLEGVLKSDYKTTDGTLVDLMYYGLLKTEMAAATSNSK